MTSQASLVSKPDYLHEGHCWAQVLQYGTFSRYQCYDTCARKARRGKLTCRDHDHLEYEAQRAAEKVR